MKPPQILTTLGYVKPESVADVFLDIVTPTRNRPRDLEHQAELLADQLGPHDRWIIVRDSDDDRNESDPAKFVHADAILEINLDYMRNRVSTVNMARHAGCSMARPGGWIIELDDHDFLTHDTLDLVRQAIVDGAGFVYGDCIHLDGDGEIIGCYEKPDYQPWMLKAAMCPGEGVRCFPAIAYAAVGGYRWHGPENEVGANEFPGGDYGLFMRIEKLYGGEGFVRIPKVLCSTVKAVGTITGDHGGKQEAMAEKLRAAENLGRRFMGP
jgi:hypothetical protein